MTKNIEEQCYLDLVNRPHQNRYVCIVWRTLSDNTLPLLTTKFVPSNVVLKELLWILKGQTDSKILHDNGGSKWIQRLFKDRDEGDLGPIYASRGRPVCLFGERV